MREFCFAVLVTLAMVATLSGAADDGMQSVVATPDSGIVTEVVDGDTVVLADGRTVDLVGVQESGDPAAKEWLEVYCLDRRITLRHAQRISWGHVRAMPVLWDRMDVCGLMLACGHCKVIQPEAVPDKVLVRWRVYEAKATRLQLGMWARRTVQAAGRAVHVVLPPYQRAGAYVWPQAQ